MSESNNFYIRMKPDKIVPVVEFVKKTFKAFDPGLPIDFHFLDDDYDNLYRTERRMGKIFGYFSLLAILISCLGLIGLSSFMTAAQDKRDRDKENKRGKVCRNFLPAVGRIYYLGFDLNYYCLPGCLVCHA